MVPVSDLHPLAIAMILLLERLSHFDSGNSNVKLGGQFIGQTDIQVSASVRRL
ncbi:hypothetical protein [Paraburkholderia lacunae]|uniref:hypothetical protein n=1 Tax=Paraburkholderia lacunae TaxID=2211104 RepID=UPI0014031778|nr:hypothetical protein [Paraburkholderia lacunae]